MIDQNLNYLCMAVLNYKLLFSCVSNNILEDKKYNNIFNESELKEYITISPANQMSLLSCLYSLYVIPYERCLYKNNLFEIEDFLNKNVEVIKNDYKKYKKTKHLRNSFAHGKIEFISSNKIKFCDSRKTDNFEMIISTENIQNLINLLLNISEQIVNKTTKPT